MLLMNIGLEINEIVIQIIDVIGIITSIVNKIVYIDVSP